MKSLLKLSWAYKSIKTDPKILLHPNIPRPLHGVNPRTVLGKEWWNKTRKSLYREQNYRCKACGVPNFKAKKYKWLEAHESYNIDYKKGIMTLKEIVAICHYCHNFIHSGRLQFILDEGKITAKEFTAIREHGMKIIKRNKLTRKYNVRNIFRGNYANDEEWRLIIDGKEYRKSDVPTR